MFNKKFNNYFHSRNVDDVHNMMDDIAESQDLSKEISEAISNPVAFGTDIDEVSIIIFHFLFYKLIFLVINIFLLNNLSVVSNYHILKLFYKFNLIICIDYRQRPKL